MLALYENTPKEAINTIRFGKSMCENSHKWVLIRYSSAATRIIHQLTAFTQYI